MRRLNKIDFSFNWQPYFWLTLFRFSTNHHTFSIINIKFTSDVCYGRIICMNTKRFITIVLTSKHHLTLLVDNKRNMLNLFKWRTIWSFSNRMVILYPLEILEHSCQIFIYFHFFVYNKLIILLATLNSA